MSLSEITYQVHMAGVLEIGFSLSALVKLCVIFLTAWRTPEEASDYLWAKYRVKRNARRLAQLRATGEGPKYFRDGNVVRYREDHLDEFAEGSLGKPSVSTAEEHVRREAECSAHNREVTDASTT
jgi:hypothetical protein